MKYNGKPKLSACQNQAYNQSIHRNYEIILDVERTLKLTNPQYAEEINGINKIRQTLQDKHELSINDHVKAMVLSLLSCMRKWEPIEQNLDAIQEIFCGYDVDKLKNKNAQELVEEVKNINCGNLRINRQMTKLKANIETLERLNANFGSLDEFYTKTDKYELVSLLSMWNSKYKLQEMGIALVCEYLKGVGIPLVKPDRHVCRIIGRLGFTKRIPADEIETLRICDKIAESLKMSHAMVDTILWQYGVKEKCGICGDIPQCSQCGVTSCSNRSL